MQIFFFLKIVRLKCNQRKKGFFVQTFAFFFTLYLGFGAYYLRINFSYFKLTGKKHVQLNNKEPPESSNLSIVFIYFYRCFLGGEFVDFFCILGEEELIFIVIMR